MLRNSKFILLSNTEIYSFFSTFLPCIIPCVTFSLSLLENVERGGDNFRSEILRNEHEAKCTFERKRMILLWRKKNGNRRWEFGILGTKASLARAQVLSSEQRRVTGFEFRPGTHVDIRPPSRT